MKHLKFFIPRWLNVAQQLKALCLTSTLFIAKITCSQTIPNMGATANFGLLSGGVITSINTINVNGTAGATTAVSSQINAATVYTSGTSVSDGLASLVSAKTYLYGQSGTSISGTLNGQHLSAGVYSISGNASLSDTIVLNGDTSSVFIFNISGTLTFNSSAVVYAGTSGAVRPYKIFWNVQSTTIDSSATLAGVILSSGTVSLNGPFVGLITVLSSGDISFSGPQRAASTPYIYSGIYVNSYAKMAAGQYYSCTDNRILPCGEYITNGDFESNDATIGCIFDITQPGEGYSVCNWSPGPWPGFMDCTPDIFNVCAASSDVGVPLNGFGNQAANSGNQYIGLYSSYIIGMPLYPETFTQKLVPAGGHLTAGREYFFEMYVSLAEVSNLAQRMAFILTDGTSSLPIYQFETNSALTNKTTWVPVRTCFTALGTEKEIRIGTVFGNTSGVPVSGASGYTYSGGPNLAYYYIDDVSIKQMADAGANKTVCGILNTSLGVQGCSGSAAIGYVWSKVSGPGTVIFSTPASSTTNVTVSTTGTYVFRLTGTYGGCTLTDDITVTFATNPNPSISPMNPSICLGGAGTNLVASGGSTYLWSNGVFVASNPVNPTVTTGYTVAVFNSSNCSATLTSTVAVNNPPVATINPSSLTICSGTNATLTASGGGTYSWSGGGTGTTKNVSPVSTSTFTVTVTGVNTCTATTTSTVIVNTTCCNGGVQAGINGGNALTFYDLTASQLSILFGGVTSLTTATTIAISGTFTVDMDFTIHGCASFVFGRGAKIVINNGKTLKIDGTTTLKSCGPYLWKGIEAQFPGSTALGGANQYSLIISPDNVSIEDALLGVECWNTGRYSVTYGKFNKNYISIFAHNLSNSLSTISNSTFKCTAGILPSWPGSTIPVIGGINSYIGIDFNSNVVAQNCGVNGNSASANIFTDLNCGILGINTSFNSYYSNFYNISNYQAYQGSGWCIHAKDYNTHPSSASPFNVNIVGSGKFAPSYIVSNVRNGFNVENINALISDYSMNNVNLNAPNPPDNVAINALNCIKDNVTIRDNEINGTYAGIKLTNNIGSFQQALRNDIFVFDVPNTSSATAPPHILELILAS